LTVLLVKSVSPVPFRAHLTALSVSVVETLETGTGVGVTGCRVAGVDVSAAFTWSAGAANVIGVSPVSKVTGITLESCVPLFTLAVESSAGETFTSVGKIVGIIW